MPSSRPIVRLQGLLMVGGIALLAAGLIFYLSACQHFTRLALELGGISDQIAAIESSFSQDNQPFVNGVQALENDYQDMLARFPAKEEEGIRRISDAARENGLEMISIRSEPKTLFLDQNKGKILLDGRSCQQALIAVEIRGRYQDLVQYLTVLREQLPVHVTVEQLRISRHPGAVGQLDIYLDLNLYLAS